MALRIYKSGQGYWTRVLSAAGAGAIVLSGVLWLWQQMEALSARTAVPDPTWWDRFLDNVANNMVYYQSGMAVVLLLFFGWLLFWLLNKPNIADFMIATEVEMKKVNWPSRKEIIGSTWVVICGTLMLMVLLRSVDMLFALLFREIGVLIK